VAGDDYDWWAAEGRPERLRPLQDELDRLMDDRALVDADVTIFEGSIDMERERLQVEIATSDPARARRVLRDACRWPIEIVVVAPAPYVENDVPWTSWEPGLRDRELFVWAENLESLEPHIILVEDDQSVTIRLRQPRWQGSSPAVYSLTRVSVTLSRPLGGRRVIDGATGRPRTQGPPSSR
jgi:hypothetical protein